MTQKMTSSGQERKKSQKINYGVFPKIISGGQERKKVQKRPKTGQKWLKKWQTRVFFPKTGQKPISPDKTILLFQILMKLDLE